MEVEVPDREAGLALITSEIVEAWIENRNQDAPDVTGGQLCELIMGIRAGLTADPAAIRDLASRSFLRLTGSQPT